jgi:hypothetical protein
MEVLGAFPRPSSFAKDRYPPHRSFVASGVRRRWRGVSSRLGPGWIGAVGSALVGSALVGSARFDPGWLGPAPRRGLGRLRSARPGPS